MAEIGVSVASKVAECLVDSALNQLRYIFCFNNIVQEFKEHRENLTLALEQLEKDVETAQNNVEEIEKDVEKWLKDARQALVDAGELEKEIEGGKKCFTCHLNWNCGYPLGRKVAKKTIFFTELLQNKDKFKKVGRRPNLSSMELTSFKDSLLFSSSNLAFNEIMEALKDGKVNKIGLYGMGGVGKTTLAEKVGKEVSDSQLFRRVIRVVVSQTVNLKDMQNQIAKPLGLTLDMDDVRERAKLLQLRFKNEKVLIILDDVWKELDWTDLGISHGQGDHNKGCKILLTTRDKQVCIDMGIQRKVGLDVLTEEEARDWFRTLANVGCASPFNEVANEVAKECAGLPIAIVTLAKALKDKALHQWKATLERLRSSKLGDMLGDNDRDKNAYACLKLSYDYLMPEQTKLVFLFCSLFPEDSEIDVEVLVRYSLGLQLYKSADQSIEYVRNEVLTALDQLEACCLLSRHRWQKLKMHDMVRDVALWISSKRKDFLVIRDQLSVPEDWTCEKLEIFVFNREYFNETNVPIPSAFFDKMKLLKVLTVQRGIFSVDALQFPASLRVLCLENCSQLGNISSLRMLKKLEMLRFTGSDIFELPNEVGELSNLRYLDLCLCKRLQYIRPNSIRRLSQLEELYIGTNSFKNWAIEGEGDDVSESRNASLLDLNSLPRLKRIDLTVHPDRLPKDFVFPDQLTCYWIYIGDGDWQAVVNSRRCLVLKDQQLTVNAFKKLLHNVQYIELRSVTAVKNLFTDVESRGSSSNLFLQDLEEFHMRGCHDLLSAIPATLENLRKVRVSHCEKLQVVFQMSEEEKNKRKEKEIHHPKFLFKFRIHCSPKFT